MARKMGSPPLRESELDFEDVLARFETNFSGKQKNTQNRQKQGAKDAAPELVQPPHMEEVVPELKILWEELVHHVVKVQNKAPLTGSACQSGFHASLTRSGIGKQIIKNEIRSILTDLRNPKDMSDGDSDQSLGAEVTSYRSLKKLVTEKTEELHILRRNFKQTDTTKHRLEETVNRLGQEAEACKKIRVLMEEKVVELREQKEVLEKKCFDMEEASTRFNSERARFQSTIARYREELLLASHQTETAQLEASQAKSRAEEVEKRAAEAKASSSAVQARIKELSEVQDAMIALMKEVKESGKSPAQVQRNLEDLGEKRSRLVGRIANLLTRNRQADAGQANTQETAVLAAKARSNTADTSGQSDGVAELTGTPGYSGDLDPEGAESEGTSRRPILDGIRKFGNELTRVGTNRNNKKSLLANVERSTAAIENDTTLREVIEMKDREVERLAEELETAREKAASLEMTLQQERHKHRTDNRAISTVPTWRGEEGSNAVLVSRNKTLFAWHSGMRMESSPTGVDQAGLSEPTTSQEPEAQIGMNST